MSIRSFQSRSVALFMAVLLATVMFAASPAVADGNGTGDDDPSPGSIGPGDHGYRSALQSAEDLAWWVDATNALCFMFLR